jgi:hypothetical protein
MKIGPDPQSAPDQLPRRVRAARALTFAGSGVVLLTGLLYVGLSMGDAEELERQYEGVDPTAIAVVGVLMLAHGAFGVVMAMRYATGGARVRLGGLVWGGLGIVVGLGTVPLGLVVVVLATLVIVNLARAEAREWFGRPRP